ncbi:hypothetical protein AK812_SmicGene47421, partial [Symbiodinium microadriaticum]
VLHGVFIGNTFIDVDDDQCFAPLRRTKPEPATFDIEEAACMLGKFSAEDARDCTAKPTVAKATEPAVDDVQDSQDHELAKILRDAIDEYQTTWKGTTTDIKHVGFSAFLNSVLEKLEGGDFNVNRMKYFFGVKKFYHVSELAKFLKDKCR